MSSAAAFASLRAIHISCVTSLSWLVLHMLMLACAVVASECISLRLQLLSTYFQREVVSLLWLMSTRQNRNTRLLQGIYTPAACVRHNGVLQLLYNERRWIGAITGSGKPFWCYQKRGEDAFSGREMDRKYSVHFIRSGKELWNMQIPDNVKGGNGSREEASITHKLKCFIYQQ